jgi:hypothetical protein
LSPSLAYRERALESRTPAPNSPSLLGPSESLDDVDDVPILPMESPGLPPLAASVLAVPPVSLAAPSRMRSPSLFAGAEVRSELPNGTRLVKIKERVVTFTRASCKRASRAARPSDASPEARDVCKQLIQLHEGELKGEGRTKLSADDCVRYRTGSCSGGKGPAIRAQQPAEQAKMNHIAQLKAKNVETHNTEASFLIGGNTAEQMYDRLAESALRANAVNSSVTKRKDTQGAAYQTTRVNCKVCYLSLKLTPLPPTALCAYFPYRVWVKPRQHSALTLRWQWLLPKAS